MRAVSLLWHFMAGDGLDTDIDDGDHARLVSFQCSTMRLLRLPHERRTGTTSSAGR